MALFVVPTWPPHTIGDANDHLLSVAGLAAIWAMVAVGTAMFVNLAGLPTLAHAGLWGSAPMPQQSRSPTWESASGPASCSPRPPRRWSASPWG